jgi:hypothetical protein
VQYSGPMLVSDSPAAEAALPSGDAEAARYALLRRLAPSMRHHLVVNLQPIGMIYEVMERRLRAPQPDLSQVQESAHKINGFARAALNSCLDVVSWLAPDAAVTTTTQEGVRECASLLATSLSFRGYALRNEVASAPGQVRRSAIRNLLTSTLLYATDHHRPPAELVLTSNATDDALELLLATRASQGDKGFSNEPPYRQLEWADVQALARAEDVQVTRGDDGVRMRLPWAAAQ